VREADNLTIFACRMSWKSGILNLLEPSGPHRACYGTPLTFYLFILKLFSVSCAFATKFRFQLPSKSGALIFFLTDSNLRCVTLLLEENVLLCVEYCILGG
jgi:hypothetical protein